MIDGLSDLRKPGLETALYGGALILALGIRLLNLGSAPLSDTEASWALQALQVARGQATAIGAQPGYILLTGFLFMLAPATNGLARLLPALAGGFLVLLPWLFLQDSLRHKPHLRQAGLILAFGLALDPGLVALSRQVGSPMMTLSLGLLAAGLIHARRPVWAGITAGLALLSGPTLLTGILAGGLAWLVFWLLKRSWLAGEDDLGSLSAVEPAQWRVILLAAATTLIVAGTLLLLVPQGLGALGGSLAAYVQGWATASTTPALRLPAAILFYQPLALIFGVVGGIRAWVRPGQQMARWLSLWALAALLSGLLYPGRQTSDATWALIPLWILAALELAGYLPGLLDADTRKAAGLQAGLLTFFLILFYFNLIWLGGQGIGLPLKLSILIGILLMALIVTVLMSAGWSLRAAQLGSVWGVILVLLLYNLFNLGHVTYQNPGKVNELWSPLPAPGQVEDLVQTVTTLSTWKTGHNYEIELLVVDSSPSLRWALRNFGRATFVNSLANDQTPDIVITPGNQAALNLPVPYRGQDFAWRLQPGRAGILPNDPLQWILYHEAPTIPEHVILWARTELFPEEPASAISPIPQQDEDATP